MTGEEMERAMDFPLRSQANLEARIEQANESLGAKIEELTRVVRTQADSQGRLNQTVTRAISALAGTQAKTEADVDRLAGAVEKLAGRLAGGGE
ncbi:MAG TPA: hypothetical protein VF668_07035 [Pyrinomonadaceae bacterium]|jgi:ABC-type transporter Mla subunit MlaD